MEGERGELTPIYDHLQISFSAPHAINHEMGFVHFEDHHNQVLSFLAMTAPTHQSSQMSQPLDGGATAGFKPTTTTTTTTNNGSLGLNHNELVNRPSWNNDQVVEF